MNSIWTSLFVAILAVSVIALNENENNYLQELLDAGISQETANKLVDITASHNNDGEISEKSGKTIFQEIISETDAAIKQAPANDQQAYKAFVESKAAEFGQPDEISIQVESDSE
ncbi:Minor capsid protein [Caenorhabditis elegans]|uniref:Minor capsid protein n=1 Tax=Caenorhabditis elegans TaxID=6239 RepID=Q20724_CAEEL|nr:Minor capsid protein [Caenorhabditis elegans]CAB01208.1 Minor capsid protein [Caenorhabditis elegans]|eukprot:NP_506371.1 Uncharacterized protein CELE_F53F4.13 [Caenorhabditis elegans]